MKTLLLLRHAKSSHKKTEGMSDAERPLRKSGKRDAVRMAKVLVDEGVAPDLILTSSAERAAKTAKLVAKKLDFSGQFQKLPELYLAEPAAVVAVLQRLGGEHERVLVVGHNPGIEELVQKLTGEVLEMPTGGLAECALPVAKWGELSLATQGKLRMARKPEAGGDTQT